MSLCLIVPPAAPPYSVRWSQKEVSERMHDGVRTGRITFIGAVPALNVFAVACEEGVGEPNPVVDGRNRERFFVDAPREVRGDVVFIGSDDDGDECDVDVAALAAQLSLGSPYACAPAACTRAAACRRLRAV